MTDPISIVIVTPDSIVFEGSGFSVMIPAEDGYMEFQERHAPLVTPLGIGILTIKNQMGKEDCFFVSGGYAEIHEDTLIVLADSSEHSDDIDAGRATHAKDRATKRILDQDSGKWDIDRAQVSLARALCRLKTTERTRKER